MKTITEILTNEIKKGFEKAGYRSDKVRVTNSNRPDLCMYQCNAAMALAKEYKCKPIDIAEKVLNEIDRSIFSKIEVVMPGFININLTKRFIIDYINEMYVSENFGYDIRNNKETIVIDYGGANVAKPLHVGHLRSAVIGEAIKRILKFDGNNVIGDVHLGDWGLQMGLIISQLQDEQPELPYFDENYVNDYPIEAPFTIGELEEIYPKANLRSKEDENFKEKARLATLELQNGRRGYNALWQHIINVSIADLKRNYDRLDVNFDLWKKESDAQKYIPDMVDYMKKNRYTRVSDGALVVDVKTEEDVKEIPPCMILKSNGATLYNTTDLATIVERVELFNPDRIIYVVDKRQELYFEQVFRCAKKTKIIENRVKLDFVGFGTMNGKDGKPFKTRDGGVVRLEKLQDDIKDKILDKLSENIGINVEDSEKIANTVALSAIKYGDLSNQISKDYIFDIDRFASFDGETGPYILYTMVRIKSILSKYEKNVIVNVDDFDNYECMELLKIIINFNEVIGEVISTLEPHKLCKYVYEVANKFNSFYHSTKILKEENENLRNTYLSLCKMTLELLELCINLLGFESPKRM